MAHMALVISVLAGGGAERSVLATAGGLAARGHKVDIVLTRFHPALAYKDIVPETARLLVLRSRPTDTGDFPERTVWYPERVSRARLGRLVPDLFTRWPAAAPALLRRGAADRVCRLAHYFDSDKPDIVFANLPNAEYAAYFASRIASASPPVIPVIRNADGPGSRDGERRRYVWHDAPQIVAVSRGVARVTADALGLPADRFSVIYNPSGTVPEIERLTGEAPSHPWLNDGGPPVILGAGHLTEQKDFGTLIDAFQLVRDEHPCRLVVLGEGPLRGELENRVRSLGLEGCVSLPGWAENPFAYMARAALFVLSSRHEGLPGVLIQALSCGCPAVSTDCPFGPSEILEDPDLLAPVGNPKGLARVMLRALSRPPDKAVLRARAARFSLERTVEGYERFLAGEPMRTARPRRPRAGVSPGQVRA